MPRDVATRLQDRFEPPMQSSDAVVVHHADTVRGPGETGFLLADTSFKPIYMNGLASAILCYPNRPRTTPNPIVVQQRIQTILQARSFVGGLSSASFLSGRRRYVCRSFLVESQNNGTPPAFVALVLERPPRDPIDLSEMSRRFHLSRREGETIQHLVHGLTTKEVAQRMGVSPNTVKQFLRLIMSKMGVTTRSGILGRLMGG